MGTGSKFIKLKKAPQKGAFLFSLVAIINPHYHVGMNY